MTRNEAKKIAADVFDRYPTADNVAITEDGQAFLTDQSRRDAENHSLKNRSRRKLKIHDFTRSEIIEERTKNGEVLIEKLEELKTSSAAVLDQPEKTAEELPEEETDPPAAEQDEEKPEELPAEEEPDATPEKPKKQKK